MNSSMKLRKLLPEERSRTRRLWEEIFTQDTKEFLDYYYSVKIKENEIYVIEDEGKIVSMIHLNPYDMRVGNEVYKTHYIVAVATDPTYRKRGLMASLLHHAMDLMAERGEPFTFLMPANEAIYKPFGFEFIYTQSRVHVCGKDSKDEAPEVKKAEKADCASIADFANTFLKKYDVVTQRNVSYYETLLEEYTSENGGLLIAKREGNVVGVLNYAKGDEYEVLEPLFERDEDFKHAIFSLTGNETDTVHCMGYGAEESKPVIMAKGFKPGILEELKKAKVFLNEVV